MFGTQHLTLFIISGLLLNLTPGQDTLYIVSRSVSQGRLAGFLSVLGIRMLARGSFGVLLKRATGALFVGLGLRLAVSR